MKEIPPQLSGAVADMMAEEFHDRAFDEGGEFVVMQPEPLPSAPEPPRIPPADWEEEARLRQQAEQEAAPVEPEPEQVLEPPPAAKRTPNLDKLRALLRAERHG